MTTNGSSVARSNYRQLRLTITHETNGRLSYSVYAKRLEAQWHEHQCLARGSAPGTVVGLQSTEDVVSAIIAVLEEHYLLFPTPRE